MNWPPKFYGRLITSEQKANFWLTSAIALFTVVNSVATITYVCFARRAAQSSETQTERLIRAANVQADAATRMATASQTQAGQMTTLANQAIDQANAARQSAQEAKDSNDFARDSLIRVQRALVVVDPVPSIQVNMDNTGTKGMWFNFFMENTGTTPTRRLEAHINVWKGPTTLPNDFGFPDVNSGPNDRVTPIIGPKSRAPLIAGPISEDSIEKLDRKEVHLYAYGWVRYNDIFDKTPRHITKFCFEIISAGLIKDQSGQVTPGIRVITTGTHFNCYDEECQK